MPYTPGVTKAVIFDLDDTLYDCSGTLVHTGRLRAAHVIADAVGCSEREAYELQLKEEEAALNGDIYENIARRYSLPPDFRKNVRKALSEVSISGIKPFPGVIDVLKKFRESGLMLFIVTAGRREVQEEKIHVLGLDGMFDGVIILETTSPEAKKSCFKEIMDRHGLKPEEVLCVGDRMDRELGVAGELGMTTAMVKHGRHYRRFAADPDSGCGNAPDIYIDSVADLAGILAV